MEEKYPQKELTSKIIGMCIDIYKQIGSRYPEKVYQKSLENKLTEAKINYKKENYCKIEVDGKRVGSFRLDFLVDDCVIIELKVRNEILNKDIGQILTYMRLNEIKVGLLVLFTNKGAEFKRFAI